MRGTGPQRSIGEVIAALEERSGPAILATTALEVPRWTVRAVFGSAWLDLGRVALLVTRSRVYEVALGVRDRPGRVRSFGAASLRVDDEGLNLELEKKHGPRWRLLAQPSDETVSALRTLASGTDDHGGTVHCSRCLEESTGEGEACGVCGAAPASLGQATGLALALPGGGPFYAGWWARGFTTMFWECLLLVVWAAFWAGSADWSGPLVAIVVFPPLFVGMKLRAVAVARELAVRAPAMTPSRRKRWRTISVVGALVSAILVLSTLPFRGVLDDEVHTELHFSNSWQDWQKRAGDDEPDLEGPATGEHPAFRHTSGLQASLASSAAPRWVPLPFARDLLRRSLVPVPSHLEEWRSGPLTILAGHGRQGQEVVLHYLVIDSRYRDVHHLMSQTEPERREDAEAALESLVRRAHPSGV